MRWNPPIALSAVEQIIAARIRKARKFFVLLRECRHELLDAAFQHPLPQSSHPGSGGHEPVEAGLVALATLWQAYGHVGDRDAVELTVMDKRWQRVLDCLGAAQPPVSQGTLCNFRMRLMAHNVDKTLWDRPVALAEQTGGFGVRQLRAKMKTQRGRASLRKRTAVEHAISHQRAHQGRRARYKGLRKHQCDGRRHAAVSNLQVAAHYAEERQLAS